jgi:Holliday junction DNA helicase RuvB
MSSTEGDGKEIRVDLDATLRPANWKEYIGQEHAKENLKISIEAAKSRGELPEHLLFYGPPGVGKTTLAHIIGHELGRPVRITSGVAVERAADLAAILTNLEPGDVLFIDEIHQLSKKVEELLYPALEAGRLDIILGKGPSARTVQLDLPPFALVGATTRIAQVSSPLRSRFGGGVHQLDLYTDDEIRQIITRSSKLLSFEVPEDVLAMIASRSRSTPRTANYLLKRFRDYVSVQDEKPSPELLEKACTLFGIDHMGLTKDDRRYLKTLIETFKGGPVGIKTLATALGEEVATLEDLYEPFLIRLGFIDRTARGRIATDEAYKHLGL